MKLQYLAVIFVLIIIPINIVFSEYINNQIKAEEIERTYDTRLFSAAYDSIKAYQLNTINNATSDIPTSKVKDLEAATNTFFNSLSTNFKISGYSSTVMKDFVPATVFTMYDGYYIYSPFVNTLAGVSDDAIEDKYKNSKVVEGLKPYVYYNCRYKKGTNDFVITYTLDNYITIEGFIGGEYRHDSGYLVSGIEKIGDSYKYNGITFTPNDKEELKEYLGDKLYSYAKIDGTKYYYEGNKIDKNGKIIYIPNNGEINIYQAKDKEAFEYYYNRIFSNTSGYEYYKKAYEFSKKIEGYGLDELSTSDIVGNDSGYEFAEISNIFGGDHIEESDSNFNRHRQDVIRYSIQTNLAAAISGFSKYSKNDKSEFIMPKISETDWEILENNVCIAAFLQGMNIGNKIYNNYAVVSNNLTKDYVDENDIYFLTTSNEYTKANDAEIIDGEKLKTKTALGYYPGVLKINFERKKYYASVNAPEGKIEKDIYYYPISYKSSEKIVPYLGSYTSIVGSSTLNNIQYSDMYKYMRGAMEDKYYKDGEKPSNTLKKAYYMALGREREGTFKINN